MELKDIKVRVRTEKEIRIAFASLVAMGYVSQNNMEFYATAKANWLFGEANRYPSVQLGVYCIEWDTDIVFGISEPHEEVTVEQLQEMAGLSAAAILEITAQVADLPEAPATIEISWEEYKDLQKAARELQALEDAGVDNWQGYCDAMREANQDEDE